MFSKIWCQIESVSPLTKFGVPLQTGYPDVIMIFRLLLLMCKNEKPKNFPMVVLIVNKILRIAIAGYGTQQSIWRTMTP